MPTALGWTVLALQVALAVILFRRKLYRPRRFPFFTAYTLYSIAATILRRVIASDSKSYYALYWSTETFYGVLALLALNDVFRRLHRLDYKDFPWFRFLLPVTALLIVAVSVWEAFHNPPTHHHVPPRIVTGIFWFDLGVHSLEASIPLLFLVLKPFLLPPKSKYDWGVLWGFGVSALVTIVADTALSRFGQGFEGWFRYGPPVGYAVATLIWVRAFYRRPDWKPASEETIDALLAIMLRTQRALRQVLKDLGLRHEARVPRHPRCTRSLGLANFLFSEQNKLFSLGNSPMCINNSGLYYRRGDRANMLKAPLALRIVIETLGMLGVWALLNWLTQRHDRSMDEVIEPLRKVEETEVNLLFDPNKERAISFWKVRTRRPPQELLGVISNDAYLEQLALRINAMPSREAALRSEVAEKLVPFWSIDIGARRDQRGRLDLARELIRRMLHNAGVLGQWGSTEAFYINESREEKPDSEEDMSPSGSDVALFEEGLEHKEKTGQNATPNYRAQRQFEKSVKLRKCALRVSMLSRLALVRLFFIMLVRFDKTRFLPIPSVATLRNIAGTDLLKAYDQLKEAALEVAKEYGKEYASSLAASM